MPKDKIALTDHMSVSLKKYYKKNISDRREGLRVLVSDGVV